MGKQNKGMELIGPWQDVMNKGKYVGNTPYVYWSMAGCYELSKENFPKEEKWGWGGGNIYNPNELFEGGAFHSKVQEVCT